MRDYYLKKKKVLSLWWWIIYSNDQILIGMTGKIHSLKGSSVIKTQAGNMGNSTLSLHSPASKARPSCSLLHPRCKWRLLSSIFFCYFYFGFSFVESLLLLISPWSLKGFKFFLHFMVGKIQSKSCHWGLTSFRYLGLHLFREPSKLLNFGRKSGNL